MKKLSIVLLFILFSCSPDKSSGIWTLKSHYSVVLSGNQGMVSEDLPFLRWEFKSDTLLIDGIPKKWEQESQKLLIYGEDLETQYSIKSWTKEELMLSQNKGDGKEYLLFFKR